MMRAHLSVSNQIQEWEKEDPHDVNEMPVQADHFYRCEIVLRKCILASLDDQVCKQPEADNHVDSVHAGHGEVQKEQNLRVVHELGLLILESKTGHQMLHPLAVILKGFDSQEHRPEEHGQNQVADESLALAQLSRSYRHCHSQTATDQNSRVCCT